MKNYFEQNVFHLSKHLSNSVQVGIRANKKLQRVRPGFVITSPLSVYNAPSRTPVQNQTVDKKVRGFRR